MKIGLINTPVPNPLHCKSEIEFTKAFFSLYSEYYFSNIPVNKLANLWQIEYINQGLLYLASRLADFRYEIAYYSYANKPSSKTTKELNFGHFVDQIKKEIDQLDIICIYCITCNFYLANLIAKEIKKAKSNIIIGLGGPHATAIPLEILKHYPVFDFIGIGEGEDSLVEFITLFNNNKLLTPVAGIAINRNGNTKLEANRKRIKRLNYRIPDYSISGAKSLPAARIFPNRGCDNKCAFCADPWRAKVTSISLDKVIEEIPEPIVADTAPEDATVN